LRILGVYNIRRRVLRSIAAILSGWLVAVGGYLATMLVIALFNRETFRPGTELSVGWWLLTLFVGLVWSVTAGFVTGVIAQRREVVHAVGLVLFALFVRACWPKGRGSTMSVPDWYWITAYLLGGPSPVLGGWLRARQDALVNRIPASVTGPFRDAHRSITRSIAHFRFPIAIVLSILTFLVGMRAGVFALGAGLIVMQRYFGGVPCPDIFALPVVLIVMFLLPFLLSCFVYRKIVAKGASMMSVEE
jgi:hypothetical protein